MSRKRIKLQKKCTACNSEAGLLLITMPRTYFLRPRTKAEGEALDRAKEAGSDMAPLLYRDRKNRKVRLCPDCIKPLQKQYGSENVSNWNWKGKKQ